MAAECDVAAEVLLASGALHEVATLACQHDAPLRGRAGWAILPWRADALRAETAGVAVCGDVSQLPPEARFQQAAVVADKQRAGTWNACAAAWMRLPAGARLLVAGSNAVGIRTTIARLAAALEQEPELLAQRRRCRVAAFTRDERELTTLPSQRTRVQIDDDDFPLVSDPAVFSSGRLDAGSALLLAHLPVQPARQVLDLGCGSGLLGIAALRRHPAATATFVDGDRRAVQSTRDNLAALGLAERATVRWWDAAEAPPAESADLVLCNPPFHAGRAVDYRAVDGMFAIIDAVLAPGGQALVVANRHLPYEARLAACGACECLVEDAGFKLLRVHRR